MSRITPPTAQAGPWDLAPSSALFVKQERGVRGDDGIVTAFRDGEVTLRSNRRTTGFTNALKEHGYQGIRAGDLVIHSMDGFAGAIGVSDSDGKASPVVHSYRLRGDGDERFYAYFLRDMARSGFVAALAKGIRERSTSFDAATFRTLLLPKPPPSAQRRIADFLDNETSRLDALVEAQTKLIATLQERRLATIRSSVSSGDWVSLPVKRLFRVVNGGTPTASRENWSGGIPWATPVDLGLHDGGLIEETEREISPAGLASGSQSVPPGSLLVSTRAPIGYVAETRCEMAFNQGCRGLSPRADVDVRYFRFQLLGIADDLSERGRGSTFRELSGSQLANVRIVIPPLDDQRRIADHLDAETEKIDALVEKAEEFIEVAKERRSALITAAVTGQIDVKEMVA